MEKKNHNNMDGFVRRNSEAPRILGRPSFAPAGADGTSGLVRPQGDLRGLGQASVMASQTSVVGAPMPKKGVTRGDIDDSLRAIDGDKKKPNKYDPYRRAHRKKIVKRVIIILLILLALGAAYFGIRTLIASSKVFKGNIFEALTNQNVPLAKDSYGRTNILVFGTSEDDGPNHGGGDLTDSIMILSVDQEKKTANLLSVPRDLWVQYGGACDVGYAGKINATYHCGLGANNDDVNAASLAFAKKVGDVFGISLQYYIKVDYTVVRDVVDSVGGVDVDIESSDPRGVLDRNFDWTCNYKCYLVKYPNGVAHLDGTHALALARARNDAGGYGLSRGNFDREVNQQKILKAVQQKALSGGTLANPVTVLNLINSLGDNIKTNFETKEISTLIGLAKDIKPADIKSLDIANADDPLVTTGTGPDGSSIVKPVAGLLDYSGLQAYVHAIWSGDTSVLENATVGVYNGSQTAGAASKLATTLKSAGFTVDAIDDATTDYTPQYTLYDLTGGKKPATLTKLQNQLGVKATTGTPTGLTATDDFVVVVGSGSAASSSSSSARSQ